MSEASYEVVDNIGVVRLDNPPVNSLSQALREGLLTIIKSAQNDKTEALLVLCEGCTFIAGADINEFNEPPKPPLLPEVIKVIENSRKPIIAAIHGTALGGGFEIALACHYRCALSSASVGFPEVKLGLIPGSGGTQRVPRLAGVEAALDFIAGGRPVSAAKAKDLGLIDTVIECDNLLRGALGFAREVAVDNGFLRSSRDIIIDPAEVREGVFESFRARMNKRARGQNAPQHIISCIEAAVKLPFDEGLQKERELFLECRQSAQSAAMRHLFFAEREAARITGVPKNTGIGQVESVAVIGCGTMGSALAMIFANTGIPVKLLVINDEAKERGLRRIGKSYNITLKKGKLTEKQVEQNLSLIEFTIDFEDLSEVDLVIEAVYENLDLKKDVFKRLDKVCRTGTILGTNTSYLDINKIAAVTARPQDVVGLHFFSPAIVMKLLEVVRAEKTSDEVITTSMRLAKRIGKIPVLAGVCYGFIGNRMYRQYVRETQLCLIEGSNPGQIDKAMEKWGMAMGPLAVGDLTGLDIGYKARQALSLEEKGDPRGYCINDALAEMGRLGRKSGRGYYRYDPGTRGRIPDPEAVDVIRAQSSRYGVERREISDSEIVDRLIFSLVNEGARILEEGIALRSGDIDVVYCSGYGFPLYRGGPMFHADVLGINKVYEALIRLSKKDGGRRWTPAPLLEKLAREGRSLAEWSRE
jgi:3-hydroxyacyl-CoA dehydrogenase